LDASHSIHGFKVSRWDGIWKLLGDITQGCENIPLYVVEPTVPDEISLGIVV
jgi:hypothetical protein